MPEPSTMSPREAALRRYTTLADRSYATEIAEFVGRGPTVPEAISRARRAELETAYRAFTAFPHPDTETA